MTKTINENEQIKQLNSTLERQVNDLIKINTILSQKPQVPEKKYRRIGIFKGAGLLILFICWIWEHSQIQKWENQRDKFSTIKALIFSKMQIVNVDGKFIDYLTPFADKIKTDTSMKNLVLRSYSNYNDHATNLMADIYELSNLNKVDYSDEWYHAMMADVFLSEFKNRKFTEKSQLDSLKSLLEINKYKNNNSVQVLVNKGAQYETTIGDEIERDKNWFAVGYIVGSLLLAVSFYFEYGWDTIFAKNKKTIIGWAMAILLLGLFLYIIKK